MTKVLIIAYDFPPYISVGGLRPHSWLNYMKLYGVEPIVVTRQWSNEFGDYRDYISASESTEVVIEESKKGTVIQTPYKPNLSNRLLLKYGSNKYIVLRRLVSAYFEFAQFVFPIGPKYELYKAADNYLKENAVDAIIATGEPFVLFKYASKLSSEHGIPWVADYRDPWVQNKNITKYYLKKIWYSFFEKKFLLNASAVTTVSDFCKDKILQPYPEKSFRIIPNGFDLEAIKETEEIKQNDEKLSIAFVGSIYDWHPIESFFEEVSSFIKQLKSAKIEINFYGLNENQFKSNVKSLIALKFSELSDFVNIYPKLSNKHVVKELARNSIFLLFNDYSVLGTKIYDYVALNRKIILCYSDDVKAKLLKDKYFALNDDDSVVSCMQENMIKETNSGVIVKDAKALQIVLAEFYDEFLKNGFISCESSGVYQYSREIQVEKFCTLVKQVIDPTVVSKTLDSNSQELTVSHQTCLICSSTSLNTLKGYESNYLVKCVDCGFVFSSQKPTEKELVDHYSVYSRDDYLPLLTIKRYNELLDEMERFRGTNNILDVGSGLGYFLEEAKKRGWNVYGTEFTDEAISICNSKGIKMRQGALDAEWYEEGFFDIVTSFEVIEHINNPQIDLKSINKVLKMGGLFYCTTPNFNSFSRRYLKNTWNNILYPEHLSYYTVETLSNVLIKSNLYPNKIFTTGISITRIRSSKLKEEEFVPIAPNSADEILRNQLEHSSFSKFLKKSINYILTIFRLGDTIKIFAIKK